MQNKQENIINMFESIAPSYDKANRILSLGVDIRWRKEACQKALTYITNNNLNALNLNILDVACGTGDMIAHWLSKVHNIHSINGIDPSSNMLQIAKNKLPPNVNLINGEAKSLAFSDKSMDILSIAYGLRNVVELDSALAEFKRVLKNNGVLVILEFTKKDKQTLLDKLALFYTRKILPIFGGLIARNYKAYKYLPDSIDDFVTLEELESKLINLGFITRVKKRYIANLCSLIIAQKQG